MDNSSVEWPPDLIRSRSTGRERADGFVPSVAVLSPDEADEWLPAGGHLPMTRTRWMAVGLVGLSLVLTACTGPRPSAGPTKPVAVSGGSPSAGCSHGRSSGALAPGTTGTRMLTSGAATGSYRLTVPRSYRPGHPSPLILLFYGFGSDPSQFSALTHLPARGSADGYLVVVPQAQGTEWQFSGHGTDAAFVNALVRELDDTYCINQRRVFAAGFSAGAAFTIFYECSHQSQIAAIATVAVDFQLGCHRPIPILAFHGTKDLLVPYQNGAIGLSLPGIKVRGTELNLADWARLDRCRSVPSTRRIGSEVNLQRWSGCADGTSVELYTIIGGGHAWPGANPKLALGLTTQQVSATKEILMFFHRF
jgi:polyhydroxybutyrate depolymerase